MSDSRRVTIVSSNGHVGAPVGKYREYVDPGHRGDFDQWLERYVPL